MSKSRRTDPQRIEDIRRLLYEMVDDTRDVEWEEFAQNRVLRNSVNYGIMVIGEAASRISKRTRDANPKFPFEELSDLRNSEEEDDPGVAHAYYEFSAERTYTFAKGEAPGLLALIRKVKPAPPSDEE